MKLRIAATAIVLLSAGGAFWAQTSKSVWDGVYTEEQAKRGETISNEECARCHGQALSGGEQAPALAGAGFVANWNGSTMGDLYERIRISMPTDAPGRLTRQENADVLAYMLRLNGFPAGKAELDRQTSLLKQIKFEAAKPK
jgi:cytochrome c